MSNSQKLIPKKELNLNSNKISIVDFDILAKENLKNLQHLDISDNPLNGFKSLDKCPNHPLTMHIDTLTNFTIFEDLETSKCFANDSQYPVKIDLTGSKMAEPIACDHWCKFNDIMQQNILIDTSCNCTEIAGDDADAKSATSSGSSSGTTSSGLKKVFFVILFLIFLLVLRYHWKTIRSFWFKLRNKNHSDHGKNFLSTNLSYHGLIYGPWIYGLWSPLKPILKNHSESLLTENRVTYRRNLSSMYSMLPEEHGDSDLDDEGTGDSLTLDLTVIPFYFLEITVLITVHESLQKDEIMIAQIMTSSSGPSLK